MCSRAPRKRDRSSGSPARASTAPASSSHDEVPRYPSPTSLRDLQGGLHRRRDAPTRRPELGSRPPRLCLLLPRDRRCARRSSIEPCEANRMRQVLTPATKAFTPYACRARRAKSHRGARRFATYTSCLPSAKFVERYCSSRPRICASGSPHEVALDSAPLLPSGTAYRAFGKGSRRFDRARRSIAQSAKFPGTFKLPADVERRELPGGATMSMSRQCVKIMLNGSRAPHLTCREPHKNNFLHRNVVSTARKSGS